MLMMKILSVTVTMTLFLTSVIKQGELILTVTMMTLSLTSVIKQGEFILTVTMMTLSLTSVIKQGEFILTRDDDTVLNICHQTRRVYLD
jgi:hypothetical protein